MMEKLALIGTIHLQHTPERDPQIRISTYAGSDAFVCITLERSPIYPVGSIVLPLAGVAEVIFYGLAWLTVLYIRKASLRMSQKSRKLNIQLSLLLLMQVRLVDSGYGFKRNRWQNVNEHACYTACLYYCFRETPIGQIRFFRTTFFNKKTELIQINAKAPLAVALQR